MNKYLFKFSFLMEVFNYMEKKWMHECGCVKYGYIYKGATTILWKNRFL